MQECYVLFSIVVAEVPNASSAKEMFIVRARLDVHVSTQFIYVCGNGLVHVEFSLNFTSNYSHTYGLRSIMD